jgi:BirA family biotin operon repressor/biotin-[acetyl-CoA-carboxylase] ligase
MNVIEILSSLKKQLSVCKKIKYYKKLPSTQLAVKKLAEKGFEEGFIVVAEKQTSGYGRSKKVWSSNVGGLWFSILLKPIISPDEVSKLTLLLSVALKRTLKRKYQISSKIKWPNDVLVCDKKIAGIIVEMFAEHDRTNWVVAGIGININNDIPKNLENISVSLKDILKKEADRAEFMTEFLIDFEKLYLDFQKDGFNQFLEEYNDNLAYKNKSVSIDTGRAVTTGINLGIDEEGMLIIKTLNSFEKIISGTLRRSKECD